MFTAFLIKYAEIGVKGKNRYLFEDALVQQIKYALKRCEGEFKVRKTQGRIYVDAVGEFDFDETVDNLKTVFGISGICPVVYVEDEGLYYKVTALKAKKSGPISIPDAIVDTYEVFSQGGSDSGSKWIDVL